MTQNNELHKKTEMPVTRNSVTSNPMQGTVNWTDWTPPSSNCIACRFFDAIPGTDAGICHRYPKEEVVESDYWCGEFSRSSRMETK